jgi:SAM-dependent methyltransferase
MNTLMKTSTKIISSIISPIKKSFKSFYKTTLLQKIFYILTAFIIFNIITTIGIKPKEGFEDRTNEFIVKKGVEVYDEFYVNIYDDLVFSKLKDNFEIGQIIKNTNPTEESYILDIGSGTGHHVKNLSENGYKAIGIDTSPAMIKKAKETYPDMEYENVDALSMMSFPQNTFTHITCLYFTLYYMNDKRMFFNNCMSWLKPGGFLAVHLVDRNKFDPIIPAGSPFSIVSPQNYAKKRITSSVVNFDKFEYKANFDLKEKENIAVFNETFKWNNGGVRQNEHNFYMETQREILSMAKDAGFILDAKIDMLKCQYEHQFIYILQKPT